MYGTVTDARFLKGDINTGFVILKIPKAGISAETKEVIDIAPLGESYAVEQGNLFLQLEVLWGIGDSVGYGIITSTCNTISKQMQNIVF